MVALKNTFMDTHLDTHLFGLELAACRSLVGLSIGV